MIVTEPTFLFADSPIIQNNADSNLRIQSVVDKRNLMDLSTDYNPNNVFVPQGNNFTICFVFVLFFTKYTFCHI